MIPHIPKGKPRNWPRWLSLWVMSWLGLANFFPQTLHECMASSSSLTSSLAPIVPSASQDAYSMGFNLCMRERYCRFFPNHYQLFSDVVNFNTSLTYRNASCCVFPSRIPLKKSEGIVRTSFCAGLHEHPEPGYGWNPCGRFRTCIGKFLKIWFCILFNLCHLFDKCRV